MSKPPSIIAKGLLRLLIMGPFLIASCAESKPSSNVSEPTKVADHPGLHDTRIRQVDNMVMLYVPAGTFTMGSTEGQVETAMALCDEYPDAYGKCKTETFELETPQHQVTVEGFWIDQTEVANAQYEQCVREGSCRESRLANNALYNEADYPVAGIPWMDAVSYCEWAGGRLPTEAEWEYAARGPQGSLYPWGDDFDCEGGNFWDECSRCDDGYDGPAPVGSFPSGVSWCGALDMAGNTWEWALDQYEEPSIKYQSNVAPSEAGGWRVLRGGSWGYCPAFVRTTYRYIVQPEADYLAVGFRCVLPSGGEDE
jgi:formylglycine-generating enzyme required for sulfatase activity